MTDKEKIKQEIERRIENLEFSLENNCVEKHSKLDILGNITTLESLLQFLESIPEPASEDLDREIGYYTTSKLLGKRNHSTGVYHLTQKECDNIARHFAEWQKKKDQETIELAEDHAMLAGMNKMKEEMMKDAVEAFVNIYENTDDSNYVEFVTEQSPYKFKETEKCKIIIVKEE